MVKKLTRNEVQIQREEWETQIDEAETMLWKLQKQCRHPKAARRDCGGTTWCEDCDGIVPEKRRKKK